MIAFLSQQKKEEKKDTEKQASLGSPGTQHCKRRSRGHLHVRGPGCVFFDVLHRNKKADCTFVIVIKGRLVFT